MFGKISTENLYLLEISTLKEINMKLISPGVHGYIKKYYPQKKYVLATKNNQNTFNDVFTNTKYSFFNEDIFAEQEVITKSASFSTTKKYFKKQTAIEFLNNLNYKKATEEFLNDLNDNNNTYDEEKKSNQKIKKRKIPKQDSSI